MYCIFELVKHEICHSLFWIYWLKYEFFGILPSQFLGFYAIQRQNIKDAVTYVVIYENSSFVAFLTITLAF